jgi:DNA polymerase-1
MTTSPLLLIDGDQYLFKAAAAVERDIRWDEDNHVLCSNRQQAWDVLKDSLDRVFTRFDSTRHALCFTNKVNFRKAVDPTYKNNRAASRKPLCYSALRTMLDENYKTIEMPSLEADDVMGILATKPSNVGKAIIVSQDKDMKTIPTSMGRGGRCHHQ